MTSHPAAMTDEGTGRRSEQVVIDAGDGDRV
jgi:hypothetical protein